MNVLIRTDNTMGIYRYTLIALTDIGEIYTSCHRTRSNAVRWAERQGWTVVSET